MKIVVDLPEDILERVKDGYVPLGIGKYLQNSIPLPESHGRLIDADKLHYVKMLVQNPNNGKHKHIVAVRASEINKAPTIIEADGGDVE